MLIFWSIFEILIFQVFAHGIKMVETPQYNPTVNLRMSGNSNNTSKSQNQQVSIFEIVIVQVFAHGVKIAQPKVAKNGENLLV